MFLVAMQGSMQPRAGCVSSVDLMSGQLIKDQQNEQ